MSDQGTTTQAKDKAQEMAGQAQEKAHEAAGQARDRMRSQVDERSTDAGRRVRGHAEDLRSVGEQLRQQGKEQPARMAEQAADRIERAGGWLEDSDGDRILGDIEDFARRNPWAVMAGGLALGFAASRMLKASSADRYRTRGELPRTASPATPGDAGRFARPGEMDEEADVAAGGSAMTQPGLGGPGSRPVPPAPVTGAGGR